MAKAAVKEKPAAKAKKPAPSKLTEKQKEDLAFFKEMECDMASILAEKQMAMPIYSTGSLGLDLATGRGGLPGGSILEIFGAPKNHKTFLLDLIIKSVQEAGKRALVAYTEEPNFIRQRKTIPDQDGLGSYNCYRPMDEDERSVLIEKRLEQMALATRNTSVGCIAVDSLKGMISAAQVYDKGDKQKQKQRGYDKAAPVAGRAKLLEKLFDDLKLYNRETLVVLTNQYTAPIASLSKFQKPNELERTMATQAGSRKEFEAFFRFGVKTKTFYDKGKQTGLLDEHKVVEYYQIRVKVYQSRFNTPCTVKFHLRRTPGTKKQFYVDNAEEVVQYGSMCGVIEKKNNGYVIDGKYYASKEKAKEPLDADPKLLRKYWNLILPFADDILDTPGKKQTVGEALQGSKKAKAKFNIEEDEESEDDEDDAEIPDEEDDDENESSFDEKGEAE
jgi:RecA/RadA recombinase